MSTAILGGGLSGLSAAYYLSKRAANFKLIEGSNRLGGWIKSTKSPNGVIFEQGPRTIRPKGEAGINTLKLVEELELADKVLHIPASHPAALNRMIFTKGKLHLLPTSFWSLLKRQEPFSRPLIAFLLKDLTVKSRKIKDESIDDFVSRRFGPEIAAYLIGPLLCGICAGNSKEISVNFLMRQLHEYEQQYGSVLLGLLRNFKFGKKQEETGLVLRAKQEKWSIYSFRDGCETLPLALENYIRQAKVDINLNAICEQLEFNNNEITMHINGKKEHFKHLISTISAETLAKLLKNQHPTLTELLNRIQNVSVAVINLQYNSTPLKMDAFGFLVAPSENLPILGVIFDSCCFPNPDNNTVLTVMMGGHWFEKYFGHNPNNEILLTTALEQLQKILGIQEKPSQVKINVLKRCLPQYVVGHDENLKRIFGYIRDKQLPISLCGASYYGVGVNDVILSAKKVVEQL